MTAHLIRALNVAFAVLTFVGFVVGVVLVWANILATAARYGGLR